MTMIITNTLGASIKNEIDPKQIDGVLDLKHGMDNPNIKSIEIVK